MAKQIRQLPIAPDSANPATFNARADAFVKALQPFADDANALAKQLEEFSKNVDTKSADVDAKYTDLVQKYNDFITKYGDFFAKYDIFIPKYNDAVKKHSEVEANKNHIDTVKKLIDEALERAKSFINEQNNVIDDAKTSDVSTWSSTKLKELIDLKADEITAYKEWNYKKISDDYVAKNNDAIYVDANKAVTITLPKDGKVKIMDFGGNFSQHNVTVSAGGKKFTFNIDYQKAELVFFDGEWRIVNGSLWFNVTLFKALHNSGYTPPIANIRGVFLSNGKLVMYGGNQAVIIDTTTGGSSMLSFPAVTEYSYQGGSVVNNTLMLLYTKGGDMKAFKLKIDEKLFSEIPLTPSSLPYGTMRPIQSKACSKFLISSISGGTTCSISENGAVEHLGGGNSPVAFFDMLFLGSTYSTATLMDINTKTKYLEGQIKGTQVGADRGNKCLYLEGSNSNELIIFDIAKKTYTKRTEAGVGYFLNGGKNNDKKCRLQKNGGELEVRNNGIYLTETAYVDGKKSKKTEKLDVSRTYNGQVSLDFGFIEDTTFQIGGSEVTFFGSQFGWTFPLSFSFSEASALQQQ